MLSRFIMLTVLCLSLGGCGLGGVVGLVADGEILIMKSAKGKDIQTAQNMATRGGFECTEPKQMNDYVYQEQGFAAIRYNTPIIHVSCHQRLVLDLLCADIRYIFFIADPKTRKVIDILNPVYQNCMGNEHRIR